MTRFSDGPFGVGPGSSLKALEMLESALHFLALSACSGTILNPTMPVVNLSLQPGN
jgi:hypothetical protein